ncbi:hypothetical protein EG346_12755 [Chryseobacterium carnipullorum]|uniref:Uncharacterized protein n=1 Tax=Chryseobacterium carnipullorum TaxID=1124835 RepID=A0A3G6M5R0_CHRCU|nr:hypothetical protein EG346_12755 [Chryseobacterium carnipullorum]AZA63884.1 hypothetical protein EG345_03670 [Chryseobacterium carnipullorum]
MKSSAVSTITKSLPTEFCTLVSYCLLVNFDLINLFLIKKDRILKSSLIIIDVVNLKNTQIFLRLQASFQFLYL